MLDSELLRRDFVSVAANLQRRGVSLDADEFGRLDARRKQAQQQAETLRGERNKMAKSASRPQDAAEFKNRLRSAEAEMNEARAELDNYLLHLPNLVHSSVPDGANEDANTLARKWGDVPSFDFTPVDHVELGARAGLMDFDAAAQMSAARFVVLSGALSRLHRALAQFMLDVHVQQHGYVEYYMPHLANAEAMTCAGQLPKFGSEVFVAERDDLYCIPTAEVVLVNLARGRTFELDKLPLRVTAHTPCYRREAGSHGRDTRGMLRQHQFDKVELVQVRAPEDSYQGLEEMTGHAEKILQLLELPYRVMELCAGDIGFAAAKTYDLEVWLPGQNRYREISSCSNCEAFQARRMKSKVRGADKRGEWVHVLNGSGVAVGRALVAVLENFQRADGSVQVPPVLVSYMGGLEVIGEKNGA